MKYKIIYADPPWNYSHKSRGSKSFKGCADQHYESLTNEEIYEYPVKKLQDENCALFLWVTYPKLKEGLKTIEKWGFKYITNAFTWVKVSKENKPRKLLGYYTRTNPEICLLGIKGRLKRINKNVEQLTFSKLENHSKKPDIIRVKIVELFGDLSRIELFARERFEGWDCFGDQLTNTIQKVIN